MLLRQHEEMTTDLEQRTVMKLTSKFCGFVLMALLVSRAMAQSVPADTAGITAAVENFHRTLAQGDCKSALALLADDVAILESGSAQTRAEYEREHLGEDIAFTHATKTERSPLAIQQEGNVAWTIATSKTTGTFNGHRIDSTGVELMVLIKGDSGWHIRAIHWSSRKGK